MKRAFSFFLVAAIAPALSFLPAKNRRYHRINAPIGEVYIVIDKSDYELKLFDQKGWYATYPVVFGSNSLADKRMEGDKLTPEGDYRIQNKWIHQKWSRFLLIDYPNQQNRERFAQLKASGKIPSGASIGGGIGIHGTWPREEYAVDRYLNWTDGCISLKRTDVEELYELVPAGTRVRIQR